MCLSSNDPSPLSHFMRNTSDSFPCVWMLCATNIHKCVFLTVFYFRTKIYSMAILISFTGRASILHCRNIYPRIARLSGGFLPGFRQVQGFPATRTRQESPGSRYCNVICGCRQKMDELGGGRLALQKRTIPGMFWQGLETCCHLLANNGLLMWLSLSYTVLCLPWIHCHPFR